jgi:membrane protein YdbS with pleckstrin-like domain
MLPELFDIFREVNGMPKVPGRTPWQPSLTLRRIAMMLAAAMPMLINIVISLTYILSGRGKWLMAVAQIASLALLIVIGITVLSALKRPLYLEMEHDQLDWLTSLNADENAPCVRRLA